MTVALPSVPAGKQDLRVGSPTFGAIAMRFPPGDFRGDWAVMTLDRGTLYWPDSRVEGFTDLTPVVDVG